MSTTTAWFPKVAAREDQTCERLLQGKECGKPLYWVDTFCGPSQLSTQCEDCDADGPQNDDWLNLEGA